MGLRERKRKKRIKSDVISRDGLFCVYCGKSLTFDSVTLDHMVPESKRGTYNTTNLLVACRDCNNKRGNAPFFEFCKNFELTDDKLKKFKRLYFSNLNIKILNIAKEDCLSEEKATPNILIKEACSILKIDTIDFSIYEEIRNLEIDFDHPCDRKKIKCCFEQLIKIIESKT